MLDPVPVSFEFSFFEILIFVFQILSDFSAVALFWSNHFSVFLRVFPSFVLSLVVAVSLLGTNSILGQFKQFSLV